MQYVRMFGLALRLGVAVAFGVAVCVLWRSHLEIRDLQMKEHQLEAEVGNLRTDLSSLRASPGPSRLPDTAMALPSDPFDVTGAASRGATTARVALVEFSDFQCPYCATFVRSTLPDLRRRYLDGGKVRLIFENLPLTSIHPYALQAAIAATCADQAGKFWPMHDALYADQKHLDDQSLIDRARVLGLNPRAFRSCLEGDSTIIVRRQASAGRMLDIDGTPTFLVGTFVGSNSVRVIDRLSGAVSIETLARALDAALAQSVR